jgi:serine/threonine-protein kinase
MPAALPNGRGVLFSVARGRGAMASDIAVLDTRTGKHRVLLRGNVPHYAASGHLLFVSDAGTLMAVRFDQERLTTSGEPVAVAEGVGVRGLGRADLALSSGGTLAYITGAVGGSLRELVWAARDGRLTRVDSTWIQPINARAALSPDGKRAAMSVANGTHSDVWVKVLDQGPASKIAEAGFNPNFSPDGRDLVFYGTGGTFVGPADGSVLAKLTVAQKDSWTHLEFSPDGQWLVGTLGGEVAGKRLTGDTGMVVLAGGPGLQRRPAISPDGKWIAYESDESGLNQVYVRPFPNTAAAKHQVSVSPGGMARWSRDGRELFYLSEGTELIAIPVTLGAGFSSGVPHVLFKGGPIALPALGFDVHPDGRRFLFARQVEKGGSDPDRLVVVENFFSELKARLP